MRSLKGFLTFAATIVAASVIGFGVPLLWVFIGSQLQGGSGATTLNFSVVMAIMAGIIGTYVGVLYVAGWFMARFEEPGDKQTGTAREPWMRGMTDSHSVRKGGSGMNPIERTFVVTTMLVTGAAWVWFLFFAEGGGLPNQ